MNNNYSIGIIGGAGPMASSLVYSDIIEYYQKHFNAQEDRQFPLISIISYPFSPMVNIQESDKHHESIVKELQSAVTMLMSSQPKAIGIVCNTLHNYSCYINFGSAQFVSIITSTLDALRVNSAQKVLLLGTPTTIENNLYKNNNSIEIASPSLKNQDTITAIIYNILAGDYLLTDFQDLQTIIAQESAAHDTKNIILGCTELPVLYRKFQNKVEHTILDKSVIIYDTIAILAESLIKAFCQ